MPVGDVANSVRYASSFGIQCSKVVSRLGLAVLLLLTPFLRRTLKKEPQYYHYYY
jgi:hypothetical protein